jgi:hypothetical protein
MKCICVFVLRTPSTCSPSKQQNHYRTQGQHTAASVSKKKIQLLVLLKRLKLLDVDGMYWSRPDDQVSLRSLQWHPSSPSVLFITHIYIYLFLLQHETRDLIWDLLEYISGGNRVNTVGLPIQWFKLYGITLSKTTNISKYASSTTIHFVGSSRFARGHVFWDQRRGSQVIFLRSNSSQGLWLSVSVVNVELITLENFASSEVVASWLRDSFDTSLCHALTAFGLTLTKVS